LYEEIAEMAVVDAHEHLPPEAEYLANEYCGPNMFAGGYLWHDLESAGMPTQFKLTLRDGGYRPVEAWWPQIRPYWPHVQHTGFARSLRITLRDLFGIAELDDSTVHLLAEQVQAENTPGLYQRILGQRCKIRCALSNNDTALGAPDPLLRAVPSLDKHQGPDGPLGQRAGRDRLATLDRLAGRTVQSLGDAVEVSQAALRSDVKRGAVALKMFSLERGAPDEAAAEREFREARRPAAELGWFPALRDYLFDKGLDIAAETGVPVAVHAGYFADFSQLDGRYMIPIALRRSDVRFDVFHLGAPKWRETALLGKTLPNVSLNLTWCPVISQLLTVRTLDEMIDLVPANKIIAFGGDYRVAVHKVWGHLVMAREVVAAVLSRRIEAGDFDRSRAIELARMWFHDNPARIYNV
jgi:uncharacterized protein